MQREQNNNNNNLLYQLLIEPRFRFIRHIILFCVVFLIVLNQFLLAYSEVVNQINPLPVLIGYLSVYLFFIYLNLYVLIPKLLIKSKYLYYLIALLMTAISITIADICIEYFIHRYYGIPFNRFSFFSLRSIPFVELLSDILLTSILLIGISITVFFKNWLLSMEREKALKKDKLYTQLDVLKERVAPSFLLNVLYKAGESTKSTPATSSKILLKLSRLLRYQLYDSSRDVVLLRSEINFLSDYLSLENSCNENLNYIITYPPLEKNYFVPPLSFVPIVEDALDTFREQKDDLLIELKFAITDNCVIFTCKDNKRETVHRCNLIKI